MFAQVGRRLPRGAEPSLAPAERQDAQSRLMSGLNRAPTLLIDISPQIRDPRRRRRDGSTAIPADARRQMPDIRCQNGTEALTS